MNILCSFFVCPKQIKYEIKNLSQRAPPFASVANYGILFFPVLCLDLNYTLSSESMVYIENHSRINHYEWERFFTRFQPRFGAKHRGEGRVEVIKKETNEQKTIILCTFAANK
jgi:hypothetical protein